MKRRQITEQTVTCQADPDEPKTVYSIRPISFRELDQAGDAAGVLSAHGLRVAHKMSDHQDALENARQAAEKGQIIIVPPLNLPDDDAEAVQELTRWTRDRAAAIVMAGLVGADDERFDTPEAVSQYLCSLTPLYAVRDLISELASHILALSEGVKKKSEPSDSQSGSDMTAPAMASTANNVTPLH